MTTCVLQNLILLVAKTGMGFLVKPTHLYYDPNDRVPLLTQFHTANLVTLLGPHQGIPNRSAGHRNQASRISAGQNITRTVDEA